MKLGPMNRMKRPVKKMQQTHEDNKQSEPAEQTQATPPPVKPKSTGHSLYKSIMARHDRIQKKHAHLEQAKAMEKKKEDKPPHSKPQDTNTPAE